MECPYCEKETKCTFNWVQDSNGYWYHEYWECGNVFGTEQKINEESEG